MDWVCKEVKEVFVFISFVDWRVAAEDGVLYGGESRSFLVYGD